MGKVIPFDSIDQTIQTLKQSGNKIILVGGCFDIIHAGHIEFLEAAKKLGGQLLVLVESDESVKKLKGSTRPITSQENRARVIAHFISVDYVIPLPLFTTDEEYHNLVKRLKPDIIAITRNDPLRLVKENQAKEVGAEVIQVVERIGNHSTQNIIEKIRKGD